ncbi:MAG: thiamine-phosphate kinase, partial [Oceanobacter sp.]
PPSGMQLVQSIDTQVADVHFPADGPADLIAQRALRCAVSDLAAMGATPQGFHLALTLTNNNPDWLEKFSSGLRAAAHSAGLALLGGDTTRGSCRSITVAVQGWIKPGQALLRSGAKPGDDIWLSGRIGLSAVALPRVLSNPASRQEDHLDFWLPEPRLALGRRLAGIANAAIDLSDGLIQDSHHVAQDSNVLMDIRGEQLPTAVAPGNPAWTQCLAGGDDYELLFCAAGELREKIEAIGRELDIPLTRIGMCRDVTNNPETRISLNGQPLTLAERGFQHF